MDLGLEPGMRALDNILIYMGKDGIIYYINLYNRFSNCPKIPFFFINICNELESDCLPLLIKNCK